MWKRVYFENAYAFPRRSSLAQNDKESFCFFHCALLLLQFLHLNCHTKTTTKKKQNTNGNIKEYKQCVNKTHSWLENVRLQMNEKIFSMLASCGLNKNRMWWQAQTSFNPFLKGINDALNFAVEQCALTASSSWLPSSAVVLPAVNAVNMYCQTIESIIAIIMIERHSIMFFFIDSVTFIVYIYTAACV